MDNTIIDADYINNDLALTSNAKEYLLTISKWGRFLAILGFIGTFFMLIGSISLLTFNNELPKVSDLYGENFMSYIALFYLVFALINSYLCYLLYSFCSKSKQSINSSNKNSLEQAFKSLKTLFVIIGATTIGIIVLYIIAVSVTVGGIL